MLSGATTAVPPRTSRGLVTSLQTGDPAVLEALVSDHAPRAWRLAHALTGDARVAEAVAQDVIACLLEGSEESDPARSLAIDIYRLAVTATLARAPAEGGRLEGDRLDRPSGERAVRVAGREPRAAHPGAPRRLRAPGPPPVPRPPRDPAR